MMEAWPAIVDGYTNHLCSYVHLQGGEVSYKVDTSLSKGKLFMHKIFYTIFLHHDISLLNLNLNNNITIRRILVKNVHA